MTEIQTSTHLQMPSVSGTVTLSLAELDKMRADHVAAVKLAQDLESKQMSVKVTISEHSYGLTNNIVRDERGRLVSNNFENVATERITDMKYINLESFRAVITAEERKVVQDLVDGKNVEIKRLTEVCDEMRLKNSEFILKIHQQEEDSKKSTTDFSQREALIKEQELKISEFDNQVTALHESISNMDKTICALEMDLIKWKKKKSFWFWMWGNDTKI
jgi:hypothetical protein